MTHTEATVQIPMPGMLRLRHWSQAELNLTVRLMLDWQQIAWPQATVFDAYGELGRMIEEGGVSVLESIRDTATWESLPGRQGAAIGPDRRSPTVHP